MRGALSRAYRVLGMVFLLCVVGSMLLSAYVSGAADTASQRSNILSRVSPLYADSPGACYALDTSRSEWLGGWTAIYLPIILKNEMP